MVFDEGRFLLLEDLALDFLAFLVSEKKSISVVAWLRCFTDGILRQEI